jgi:hypothetical protein
MNRRTFLSASCASLIIPRHVLAEERVFCKHPARDAVMRP